MNVGAISNVLTPSTVAPPSNQKLEEVARDFEAMMWQMLVKESHVFETDEVNTMQGNGGVIGGLLEQVLASQLAQGMDFGIARAALDLQRKGAQE